MKSVRQLLAALVLALALGVSAFAGDISCPGIAAPGQIGTPGIASPGDMNSPPRKVQSSQGDSTAPEISLLLFAIDLLV